MWTKKNYREVHLNKLFFKKNQKLKKRKKDNEKKTF